MPTPTFADIGKASKELLVGGKTGAFVYDPKVTYSSVTSSGVAFTATAVKRGERVEPSLKAAYATPSYNVDATYDARDTIAINAGLVDVAPGLKLTSSVVLPDPSSAKVGLEYAMPYLHLKSTVGLTSAPSVDLAAATGYNAFTLGGEAGYDTAKSAITKWNVGVGYTAPDHQVAALLTDLGNTVKLSYAHNLTATQTVGAEIVRKLSSADTNFTLGYARRLTNGAATKFKLDNAGTLSMLYETRLASGEKVAGTMQLQATDLSKPAKYGFALELF